MAYSHHEVPFAPVQYPLMDNISPVPPVRSEYSGNQYEQDRYRPPTPPDREDKPLTRSRPAPESRRNGDEESNGDTNIESTCNYKQFMRIKTVANVLLVIALLFSNLMQIRFLALQQYHDGIWIASIVLVSLSILFQIGLFYVSYHLIKSNIQNPQKQPKLEIYNKIVLAIVVFLTILNIVINIFMMTIHPKTFLDPHSLAILQQRT